MFELLTRHSLRNRILTLLHNANEYKKAIGLCILIVTLTILLSVITVIKQEGNWYESALAITYIELKYQILHQNKIAFMSPL